MRISDWSSDVCSSDLLLLVLLTGSAIGISYYSGRGLGSILLMVVACVLPWLLPLSVGIAVLTLSELVVVPVYMRALGFSWFEALMQAVLYVCFAGFRSEGRRVGTECVSTDRSRWL